MTTETRSTVCGLALAVATAAGCIAYERIVKVSRLSTIIALAMVFYLPFMLIAMASARRAVTDDIAQLWINPRLRWPSAIYILTWITTPLWYEITKKQSVLAGSLYEIKYVVILAIFYVLIGQQRMSLNLAFACVCALASVYFVSKS